MRMLHRAWRIFRDRRGSPTVEFALMAPVFLGLLLVAFEILYAVAAKSVIDTAVDEASRNAVTGGPTPTNTAARMSAFSRNFYIITDPMIARSRLTLAVVACANAAMLSNSPGSCRSGDPGGTGEIVRFSAMYRHNFLAQSAVCGLLGMSACPPLTMSAQIVRRNEPF